MGSVQLESHSPDLKWNADLVNTQLQNLLQATYSNPNTSQPIHYPDHYPSQQDDHHPDDISNDDSDPEDIVLSHLPRRPRISSPPLSPPSIGNLDSPPSSYISSPPQSDNSYHSPPRTPILQHQPDPLDHPQPLTLSPIG
jgi:hypothetical protein